MRDHKSVSGQLVEDTRALHETGDQYQALFQVMRRGVLCWDREGRITDANPAALRILGMPASELIGGSAQDSRFRTVREDGSPLAGQDAPSSMAIRTGQPVENSLIGLYFERERRYRWMMVNAVPRFSPGEDVPSGAFSIFEDVTERRKSEEDLRFLSKATAMLASTLDYETVLKSIAELAVPQLADWCAVDILESDGSPKRLAVTHVDAAKTQLAREFLERYPEDMNAPAGLPKVLRSGCYELTPEITDEMLVAAIPDPEQLAIIRGLGLKSALIVPLVARGRTLGAITFVQAESGRKYTSQEATLVQELAHHAGLAVDNARLYLESQRAAADLEQRITERTAALEATVRELESFSYSVSHDLRAPLRTIDGFSRAILEDYGDKVDAEGKNYLERIRAATQQMAQLIDDLLKLSRVTRSEMRREQLDLSSIAHTVAQTLRKTDPSRRVVFTIQDGLIATGDPRLLRILLDNLLGNAWKFTSRQGDAQIEFGARTGANNETVYFVRDNGAGFDMAYVDKLFGAFQRLHSDNEFKGSGIGLATAQRIVRRHGGRIWADGKVGAGATFYFTL